MHVSWARAIYPTTELDCPKNISGEVVMFGTSNGRIVTHYNTGKSTLYKEIQFDLDYASAYFSKGDEMVRVIVDADDKNASFIF